LLGVRILGKKNPGGKKNARGNRLGIDWNGRTRALNIGCEGGGWINPGIEKRDYVGGGRGKWGAKFAWVVEKN